MSRSLGSTDPSPNRKDRRERRSPAGIGDVDEGERETPEEHRNISNAGVAETDSVHGVHGRPYGVNVKLLSAVLANTITPTRTPITALMIVHTSPCWRTPSLRRHLPPRAWC